MKKYAVLQFALLVLLIAFSHSVSAQNFAKVKTKDHQLIPGTNIFMIPPKNFQPAKDFKGFVNPDDPTAMIIVIEVPGPLLEITKDFTPENLLTQNMELTSKKTVKLVHKDGILLTLDHQSGDYLFSKHILFYGDEKSSVSINNVFLKDSVQLGKLLEKSVYSTFIDEKIISNPRAALGFSMNEKAGNLQFAAVMGNAIILNRDKKAPTESRDKATIIAAQGFGEIELNDRTSFAFSRIEKYPSKYIFDDKKGIVKITIDGLDGYELSAIGKDNSQEELYQVILFDDAGTYYLLVATFLTGDPIAIADIKKVIKTFKLSK